MNPTIINIVENFVKMLYSETNRISADYWYNISYNVGIYLAVKGLIDIKEETVKKIHKDRFKKQWNGKKTWNYAMSETKTIYKIDNPEFKNDKTYDRSEIKITCYNTFKELGLYQQQASRLADAIEIGLTHGALDYYLGYDKDPETNHLVMLRLHGHIR